MRTEATRQTRWAHDPSPRDPVGVTPGGVYVNEMVWAPCLQCDLQVHATRSRFLTAGITCPECGGQIAPPSSQGDVEAMVKEIDQEEARFRGQLEP